MAGQRAWQDFYRGLDPAPTTTRTLPTGARHRKAGASRGDDRSAPAAGRQETGPIDMEPSGFAPPFRVSAKDMVCDVGARQRGREAAIPGAATAGALISDAAAATALISSLMAVSRTFSSASPTREFLETLSRTATRTQVIAAQIRHGTRANDGLSIEASMNRIRWPFCFSMSSGQIARPAERGAAGHSANCRDPPASRRTREDIDRSRRRGPQPRPRTVSAPRSARSR